jgi:hypothetical protein
VFYCTAQSQHCAVFYCTAQSLHCAVFYCTAELTALRCVLLHSRAHSFALCSTAQPSSQLCAVFYCTAELTACERASNECTCLLLCIRKVGGWNLGRHTNNLHVIFSWISSVSCGKNRASTSISLQFFVSNYHSAVARMLDSPYPIYINRQYCQALGVALGGVWNRQYIP